MLCWQIFRLTFWSHFLMQIINKSWSIGNFEFANEEMKERSIIESQSQVRWVKGHLHLNHHWTLQWWCWHLRWTSHVHLQLSVKDQLPEWIFQKTLVGVHVLGRKCAPKSCSVGNGCIPLLPGFHPLGHGDLKWIGKVAWQLHRLWVLSLDEPTIDLLALQGNLCLLPCELVGTLDSRKSGNTWKRNILSIESI